MSIESDLDAFRELALEEQIKIPHYMRRDGGYEAVYKNLDPILEEIIFPAEKVALSGNIFVSGVNQSGDILRNVQRSGSDLPILGYSNGVDVGDRGGNLNGRFTGSELVVGYCVYMPDISDTTEIYESTYAFAPVESSFLNVPDLILPFSSTMPEVDDPWAHRIDVALINDDINLDEIIETFDLLSRSKEMKREYYLQYLNEIFPLCNYELTILTDRLFVKTEDSAKLKEVDLDLNERGIDIAEIDIWPSKFGYHKDIGLSLVIEDNLVDTNILYMYPLKNIYRLDFQDRPNISSSEGVDSKGWN
ncbi:hypothetical protein KC950_00250 [Candidatus Saccharibacteria bacterium]|nr:hypothetical protein [Candidatus Saccharibacteria bacterium]